jgi:hypothetical protein
MVHFVHPSIRGHVDCFYFLAVVNNVATTIVNTNDLLKSLLQFLWICLDVELLDHMVILFIFFEVLLFCFHNDCLIGLHQQCTRLYFLHILANMYFLLFCLLAILIYMKQYLSVVLIAFL